MADQERFEDDVWGRFDKLEGKVDGIADQVGRLTRLVAIGSGVIATAAFGLDLYARLAH